MFGKNYSNGSIKWIGVPKFLRNKRLNWNLNILSLYANWGDRGSNTIPNLGSGSGGYSDGVSINWNRTSHVLPIYHWRIFENTCSAELHTRDNLLTENGTYHMQSPSTCSNPIHRRLVNGGMTPLVIYWFPLFVKYLCGEFPLLVTVSVIFLSFPPQV